jgi:type I restriction enzyme S subunit
MELKSGYKQTEVGVIPEDWEVRALGDISDIYRGASPRPIESPIWFDEKSQIGWVRISDVTKSKRRLQETTQKLSELGVRHSRFVPKGSLIMSICASVGKPVVTDIDVCIHDGFVVFERQRILQDFLYHSLKALESGWSKSGQTGSQMNLNTGIINPTKIPFPPTKAEQEAIAEALSDADALIESLEQLIAKKRLIKQGAMQELLTGKKRLPGFSGEWAIKQLGDVIEKFIGGGTPSRSNQQYWGDELSWVTVKDFATFDPWISQEMITRLGLKHSASHLIPKGTLITSTRMALGKAVIYKIDVAINQDMKALFPKPVLATQYLYFWFQYHGQSIDELGSGSTVKGISLPDLKKINFQLPSCAEQSAIATILSDMDTEITELDIKLSKARKIKQGMMQALLTGKTRLI